MSLFLENSFSLNNHISISEKIKSIPLYFLYFTTIDRIKNLDDNYMELDSTKYKTISIFNKATKYKILSFCPNNHVPTSFVHNNFAKYIYHIFHATSILRDKNIGFTVTDTPFISRNNVPYSDVSLPLLFDFSYSFNFSVISYNNIRLYFPITLMSNPYVPIDVFLITYLIHNNITRFTPSVSSTVIELFTKDRSVLIPYRSRLNHILSSNHEFETKQLITHWLQFKHSWSTYSICYFFITKHMDMLEHFSLHNLFHEYISSAPIERSADLITRIHTTLFVLHPCKECDG